MSFRTEHLAEWVTCILGDCREVLPTLGRVDAVVTDPPYGIGADVEQAKRANKRYGNAVLPSRDYGATNWDFEPIDAEILALIRRHSTHQIIFGGNYFDLPATRCWLLWDKQNGDNYYADCEMAWTNLDKPVRRIYWRWHGMIRKGDDVKEHPTQKPVGVMEWCLDQLPAGAVTICDPFAGSFSTGVACIRRGKRFIGIEREPSYFEIGLRRLSEEIAKPRLELAAAVIEQQEPLL